MGRDQVRLSDPGPRRFVPRSFVELEDGLVLGGLPAASPDGAGQCLR